MFGKNKKLSYGARKVDKIVTGFIIGGALASIFGLAHSKKGKEMLHSNTLNLTPKIKNTGNKAIGIFGKVVAFFAGIFSKK